MDENDSLSEYNKIPLGHNQSMAPFTPISTSKLRSALHIRYSIVIRRFISRANLINILTTVFLTLLTTTTMFIVTISCAQCLLMLILYVIEYL